MGNGISSNILIVFLLFLFCSVDFSQASLLFEFFNRIAAVRSNDDCSHNEWMTKKNPIFINTGCDMTFDLFSFSFQLIEKTKNPFNISSQRMFVFICFGHKSALYLGHIYLDTYCYAEVICFGPIFIMGSISKVSITIDSLSSSHSKVIGCFHDTSQCW